MAGFTTHITVSSALGAGLGWWVNTQFGLPWPTSTVIGGLCAVSGMLPDLDSDSGIPARETISFTAAIVPMLLMDRLQHHGWSVEQMILVGAPIYALIRFGVGTLLKEFTVHRGMFHSLPAMVLVGLVTFLLADGAIPAARVLKAIAVSLGYLSHLVLDELWSVEVTMTGSRLKSSSGTALKFFGKNAAANAMCWGLLLMAGFAVLQDGSWAGMPLDPAIHVVTPARPPRVTPPMPQNPHPTPVAGYSEPDPFEPLPEWTPPPRPLPAVSEHGRITPRMPVDQSRSERYESRQR